MGTKKMLSQWIRIPRDDLHIRHATNCWLSPDKVKVLIVISHRIQFERYLWISALPTLICSLDPRNLPEAKLTKLSNVEYSGGVSDTDHSTSCSRRGAGDVAIAGGQLSSIGCVSSPLESPGRDGTHQVTLVALGGSKAMHEFLVLHYLATDSAREWDVFLDSCLPACTWVRAGSRRALALHMYDKCHIAPSHRRFAHPSWIAGMKLMLDLLLGARKHRYLRRCLVDPPCSSLCERILGWLL